MGAASILAGVCVGNSGKPGVVAGALSSTGREGGVQTDGAVSVARVRPADGRLIASKQNMPMCTDLASLLEGEGVNVAGISRCPIGFGLCSGFRRTSHHIPAQQLRDIALVAYCLLKALLYARNPLHIFDDGERRALQFSG